MRALRIQARWNKIANISRTIDIEEKIYDKKSFDNWDEAINILESWKVLLPGVVSKFKDLKNIRNREAIHFNIETEDKDRETALRAINLLAEIIGGQFAFLGLQPWFIENTKGEFYIKKDWEANPFIKAVYVPNCVLAGPFHKVETVSGGLEVVDDFKYENEEISDSEFVKLREKFTGKG